MHVHLGKDINKLHSTQAHACAGQQPLMYMPDLQGGPPFPINIVAHTSYRPHMCLSCLSTPAPKCTHVQCRIQDTRTNGIQIHHARNLTPQYISALVSEYLQACMPMHRAPHSWACIHMCQQTPAWLRMPMHRASHSWACIHMCQQTPAWLRMPMHRASHSWACIHMCQRIPASLHAHA